MKLSLDEIVVALDEVLRGSPGSALESESIDFKAYRDSTAAERKAAFKGIAEASVCFANAEGGTIVVGVENAVGGQDAFVGSQLDALDVQRYVFSNTRPELTVSVQELQHGSARLIIVEVPMGVSVHATAGGRSPARVGRDCLTLSPDQISRLEADRQGRDFSAESGDKTVSDVDVFALDLARTYLRRLSDDRSRVADAVPADLCRALGVADAEGTLNRAGELIFCSAQFHIIVYQYRHTMGGPTMSVERLRPPLIVAYHRLIELVAARRQLTQLSLPNGQRADLEDFPERAVREALANAVVHRQLGIPDPVFVEHTPDLLVVTSPGPLVSGVTMRNILTTPSRPRNRSLAKAFRDLGLIEELGTGVASMYREMLRSGKEPPEIDADPERVRLTLVGGPSNRGLARYISTLPDDERNDTDALLTLLYLCKHRVVLADDLAPVLQRSRTEATTILKRLSGPPTNMLEPTRESARHRNPNYRLRSSVVESLGNIVVHKRRTADDIDRKLIAHVREYGRITNQTVRNLLEVGTPRASAILRGLVDRRILMRTTEATRGPGVEYGAGPDFPAEEAPWSAMEDDANDQQPRLFE